MHKKKVDQSQGFQEYLGAVVEAGDEAGRPADGSLPNSVPSYSSDEDLSTLLSSLPKEGAGLGFEKRVLRRVRSQPVAPMSLSRGFRLVAPLVVAGALGFVFGPGLLHRGSQGSEEQGGMAGSHIASSGLNSGVDGTSGDQSSGSSLNPSSVVASSMVERPRRAIPSVGTPVATGARVGGTPGYGSANPNRSEISRIRAEAARVRRQLEELRSAHSAAAPTVSMTLENGVVVQVDLRELLAALEQRAAETRAFEASTEGNTTISSEVLETSNGLPLW